MLRGLVVAAGLSICCGSALGQANIKVDFNNTGMFKESDGKQGTAAASGLSATEKTAVIAKMQSIFDDAVGAGEVNITTDCALAATQSVIITTGALADEDKWGNAGEAGGPAIVYEGEIDDCFPGAGAADRAKLVMAIAHVATHELGHKLGLAHNCDEDGSVTIMTRGGNWSKDQVSGAARSFSAGDKTKLDDKFDSGDDFGVRDDFTPMDIGVVPGDIPIPPDQPQFDRHTDALIFPGFLPPPAKFGYLSLDGTFVCVIDSTLPPPPEPILTFPYAASVHPVVELGGELFGPDIDPLFFGFDLFVPNPLNPDVFLQAQMQFLLPPELSPQPITMQLAILEPYGPQTGGFVFELPPIGCNPADLNDAAAPSPAFPSWGNPDGLITPADFAFFTFAFGTGDLAADINDAGSPNPGFPNFGVPDGILSPADFSAFTIYFGAGCPCTLPGC